MIQINTYGELENRVDGLYTSSVFGPHRKDILSAKARPSGNVAYSAGIDISWGYLYWDTGGFYNASYPARLTAPYTGYYHVIAYVCLTGTRVEHLDEIILYLSDGTKLGHKRDRWSTTGGVAAGEISTGVYMTAGQYVYVHWDPNGSSVTLRGDDQGSSSFTIWRVG